MHGPKTPPSTSTTASSGAGSKPQIFASDALALLHEAIAGQLRDMDRLATASLRTASRRKLKHVDRELLQDILDADSNLD